MNLRWIGLMVALLGGLAAGQSAPEPGSGRASLERMQALRPRDPWPRGVGHVVLAMPGVPEDWKGYHEPGGSFSPAFASFGISLWVVDAKDRLVTSSDTLPLSEIRQRWHWPERPSWPTLPDLPALETTTPYYWARWQVLGPARYQLHLRGLGTNALWIMVRSPGPAGGALRSLQCSGGRLFVSDRWSLTIRGRGAEVEVASPGAPDPGTVHPAPLFWPAEQPWGYARFKLLPRQEYWLTVDDARQPPESPLPPGRGRAAVNVELPESEFGVCLDAQVSQLLMGLVNNETRPGDPNQYPLNWLRDGAYVVVALARAGCLDYARELIGPFAEQDFFGGFGAEADAPGLALWALDEVSSRASSRDLDVRLWPHVQRKVQLLQELLAATGPVRKSYGGPVVPAYTNRADLTLVAQAARAGLIAGRMDWHQPLLFVNAASYRGLVGAARMAERLGQPEAGAWRALATSLREAWNRALATDERSNERSAICGFHPAWVVAEPAVYQALLEERWSRLHDSDGRRRTTPEWTYFTVAEAHQWLSLGRPDRAWNEVRYLWQHQASPGLYVWWEGRGEENTFGRWERARGWIRPPHVSPHYWTAAEMVLLQLDMLAMLDERQEPPSLVIGSGIPKDWLERPLKVENISTRLGPVSWEWRKGRLTVRWKGPALTVVPGPSFPEGVPLRLKD